jgi:pimeloyl-ACP methyl ester carboxylesterase
VNVMVVGDRRLDARAALDAEQGLRLVDPPEVGTLGGGSEIARMAVAMRAFEDRLGGARVDRVVLAGSSDPALAAVLVASKMRVPVAALATDAPNPGGTPDELNRRLIEQLVDAVLPDDTTRLATWLAAAQPPPPSRDAH